MVLCMHYEYSVVICVLTKDIFYMKYFELILSPPFWFNDCPVSTKLNVKYPTSTKNCEDGNGFIIIYRIYMFLITGDEKRFQLNLNCTFFRESNWQKY